MLPKPPRGKYDEVCQTATKERGRIMDGGGEPLEEFSIRARQSVRGSAPHEHLVPHLEGRRSIQRGGLASSLVLGHKRGTAEHAGGHDA